MARLAAKDLGCAFYDTKDIQASGTREAKGMKRPLVIFPAVSFFASFSLLGCNCNPAVQKQATSIEQAGPGPYQALAPSRVSPPPANSFGPG